MDSLPEDEIEAIWQRQKKYIDLDDIKSVTKTGVQEEIKNLMKGASVPDQQNPQANNDFLTERGFPKEATSNPKIFQEILETKIKKVSVKGVDRFQLKAGTSSFRTPDGRLVKAGQFLGGTSREFALKSLNKKIDQ